MSLPFVFFHISTLYLAVTNANTKLVCIGITSNPCKILTKANLQAFLAAFRLSFELMRAFYQPELITVSVSSIPLISLNILLMTEIVGEIELTRTFWWTSFFAC